MVTVEIMNDIVKNITTCVYRKPGSCVEQFMDKITEVFHKINFNLNIDLERRQRTSDEFMNSMYSTAVSYDN